MPMNLKAADEKRWLNNKQEASSLKKAHFPSQRRHNKALKSDTNNLLEVKGKHKSVRKHKQRESLCSLFRSIQ
ncbi:CLUMA_CG007985, isoform A [Clunio marinus]|uniref:CLUMA_CG007985, isoform A n=1 Tax=Clunio marinus TaxID=568069 RepID=A0A1J1I2B2_9DIPT|nr:CLUMA_CG007985, isoform A [Clunio marinus]